jgi:hypothetical protein
MLLNKSDTTLVKLDMVGMICQATNLEHYFILIVESVEMSKAGYECGRPCRSRDRENVIKCDG